jgi:hypothetical protein
VIILKYIFYDFNALGENQLNKTNIQKQMMNTETIKLFLIETVKYYINNELLPYFA